MLGIRYNSTNSPLAQFLLGVMIGSFIFGIGGIMGMAPWVYVGIMSFTCGSSYGLYLLITDPKRANVSNKPK